MSQPGKFADGQPCWIDIATPNSTKRLALTAFLTGLFGWEFEVGGPDSGNYSTAHSKGLPVAGVVEMPDVPSFWTTYLHATDIQKSMTDFASHGGALLAGPMQVFDLGQMAVCQDNVGAMVGLWQPINFGGFGSFDEQNAPTWFDQQSTDPKRAATFYREVFGLTVIPVNNETGAMLGSSDQQWFSVSPQPAALPASWNPVIRVDSLSRVTNDLSRLGGEILMNDVSVPGGKILVFSDPVVQAPMICFEIKEN